MKNLMSKNFPPPLFATDLGVIRRIAPAFGERWRNPSQNALWPNLAVFYGGRGRIKAGGIIKIKFTPILTFPHKGGRNGRVIWK